MAVICFGAFSLIIAVAYLVAIMFVLSKWQSKDEFIAGSDDSEVQRFTILISARNEEECISDCLASIFANKDFDRLSPQVIVVDDFSTDRTLLMCSEFACKNLTVIRMQDSGVNSSASSKKVALEYGLEFADSEYIIQLDADVIVPRNYLRTIHAYVSGRNVDFLAMPVHLTSGNSLFQTFQELDYMAMMAVTLAGIRSNTWYLANGANMMYKKSVVDFGMGRFASGDDIFAINAVAEKGGDIHFLKSRDVVVKSAAITDFKSFFWQRIRWAGKNSSSKSFWMIAVMFVALLAAICPFVLIALIPFSPLAFVSNVLALHLFIVVTADYLLLSTVYPFYHPGRQITGFLPVRFIQFVYMAGIGLASLVVKKYYWKGRQLR